MPLRPKNTKLLQINIPTQLFIRLKILSAVTCTTMTSIVLKAVETLLDVADEENKD